MAVNQQVGRVLRVLPDHRVVVQVRGEQITARAPGVTPRPGAEVYLTNPGGGWVVVAWQ